MLEIAKWTVTISNDQKNRIEKTQSNRLRHESVLKVRRENYISGFNAKSMQLLFAHYLLNAKAQSNPNYRIVVAMKGINHQLISVFLIVQLFHIIH